MGKIKGIFIAMWQVLTRLLPSYTIEFGPEVLQKRITGVFPIKVKKFIFVFKVFDPIVVIPPGTVDRIGVEVSLKVSIPGLLKAEGRGLIHGEIDYLGSTGEFFFFDPELKNFEVRGLPKSYQEEVRGLFESIMKSALSDISIFKFDEDDRKQKIAKRMLKSVKVEDERLKIEIGV
ncbi:MAG: DUF1439 domain-containing protein [Pseudomonadales bacterium]|nr:DUF1439 domain-containing protein [Pseudomonadales bacterium]